MNSPAPALFIGHGSPENALRDNEFTQTLQRLGKVLPRPRGALVISAHWLTRGLGMTTNDHPQQVFDFSGFPDALYNIQYRPHTSPELIHRLLQSNPAIHPDPDQGFDHGVWTVLKHLWPDAEVPIVQLSLDVRLDRTGHTSLAQSLRHIRKEGFMIVASGNIVHNLRELDWRQPASAFPWAQHFDLAVKNAVENEDNAFLTRPRALEDSDARMSVPSEDHYWPLLYITGSRLPEDRIEWVYEGYEYGGISLRSFLLR